MSTDSLSNQLGCGIGWYCLSAFKPEDGQERRVFSSDSIRPELVKMGYLLAMALQEVLGSGSLAAMLLAMALHHGSVLL